jgi:hypothetical protein
MLGAHGALIFQAHHSIGPDLLVICYSCEISQKSSSNSADPQQIDLGGSGVLGGQGDAGLAAGAQKNLRRLVDV